MWLSAPALPAPRPAFIYALAAYVAVVVTRSHEVVPFLSLVRPAKLSLLIVVAALAANIHQLPWKELPKSSVTKFMFATAILAILSVPGAYWPGGSAKFLPTAYLQTFLVFVLVAAGFIHRPTLWLGIHVFVLGAFAAAILGFIIPPGQGGRFEIGLTYDPNDTAAFLVIALPFFFCLAAEGGRMRKVALVGIPIVLAAIVKTGSRGGIIALALMTPFLLFYAPPRRRSMYISLIVLCGVVFSATMTPELRQRFVNLFEQSDYNFTDRDGRKAVLKRGIGYMMDNPVLGVGIDGFQYAEGVTKKNEGFGVKFTNAHNAYVQIGAELGFGGLFCFLGTIAASWIGCARVRRRLLVASAAGAAGAKREVAVATAAICALMGLSGAALFLSTAYAPVTYFMFGLCAAVALGAPRAGAPVAAPAPSGAGVRPSLARPPSAAGASPVPIASPHRGRGWVNVGRARPGAPSRWRGGLKR